jgi:hypothetical protein
MTGFLLVEHMCLFRPNGEKTRNIVSTA